MVDKSIKGTLGYCLIASGGMVIGLVGIQTISQSNLIQLILLTGIGILLYTAMAYLLRLPEMKQLLALVRR